MVGACSDVTVCVCCVFSHNSIESVEMSFDESQVFLVLLHEGMTTKKLILEPILARNGDSSIGIVMNCFESEGSHH